MNTMKKILSNSKEYIVDEILEFDYCIVGGGTAGIAAALSAIDQGLEFIIVEKNINLSGTMVSALVSPMMPTQTKPTKTREKIISLQREIENSKLSDKNNPTTIWYDGDLLTKSIEKQITGYDKARILFNSTLTDVIVEEGRIKYIIVNSFNNRVAIKSNNYLDSTGDAYLSKLSGVKIESGDESGMPQAISLRHEVANIDIHKLMNFLRDVDYKFNPLDEKEYVEFVYVPGSEILGGVSKIFDEAIANGKLTEAEGRYIQGFTIPSKPGAMTFNSPQLENKYKVSDSLGLSEYVTKGREMIYNVHGFIKENIPGFENSYVSKVANMLGIRESNRIVGQYVLNELDYANRRKFDDGIAMGDWYIDIHTDDLEVESEEFKEKYNKGEYYEIPLRSLLTNELENLIVAGRCISTTFKMQSSVRIQQTVFDMGAAASIAVKISNMNNTPLNKVDGSDVRKLNYNE